MYNTFLSVVHLVHHRNQYQDLQKYLQNIYPVLKEHFSDFEIILINNIPELNFDDKIGEMPEAIRQQIYLVNLSNRVNKNHALLAGLDRANGDYTVIFEDRFAEQPTLILDLFQKTQEQFDIVYLQAPHRQASILRKVLHSVFYYILRKFSQLSVDPLAHDTRVISRRALNSLLRLRENLRYMKPIYSIIGYRTGIIPTHVALEEEDSLAERFRTSLIAVTSYTTFLRSVMLWLFLFSLLFLVVVSANALKVKFSGTDLMGNLAEAYDGWAFLVIFIAVFFAVMCFNLYIISIYLSNIYNEIKQRPPYIIESIKRF